MYVFFIETTFNIYFYHIYSSSQFASTNDLWIISDDNIPVWISEKIEESGWTKGRLNCPSCQNRVGNFDFVSGSEHQIHLIKSKVDFWRKAGASLTDNVQSIGK